MENAVGIEAARARLGEIAEQVRTSGETTQLTRHGRPIAVIGPATAVKSAGGAEVTLYFPHEERTCVLPAFPRMGESFVTEVELGPTTSTEARWNITEIQWYLRSSGETTVGVSLDPADDHTQQIVKRQEAERIAAARTRNAEK